MAEVFWASISLGGEIPSSVCGDESVSRSAGSFHSCFYVKAVKKVVVREGHVTDNLEPPKSYNASMTDMHHNRRVKTNYRHKFHDHVTHSRDLLPPNTQSLQISRS